MCIRAAGGAAMLLDHLDLADRAQRLLRAVPDEAFSSGAITNIRFPAAAPDRVRSIEAIETLESSHPRVSHADLMAGVRRCGETEEHVAMCLSGRTGEARAGANSSLAVEEIGATLAVLGEFGAAADVVRSPALDVGHRKGLMIVLAIELVRRDRIDAAKEIVSELAAGESDPWSDVHLALGLGGRTPWSGYPYPDF
jgi:hypothetical protein